MNDEAKIEMPSMQDYEELRVEMTEHLSGKGALLQGAVLADLVATLFAGHHPAIREQVIKEWTATMRRLIPINEKIYFDKHGMPEGWGQH